MGLTVCVYTELSIPAYVPVDDDEILDSVDLVKIYEPIYRITEINDLFPDHKSTIFPTLQTVYDPQVLYHGLVLKYGKKEIYNICSCSYFYNFRELLSKTLNRVIEYVSFPTNSKAFYEFLNGCDNCGVYTKNLSLKIYNDFNDFKNIMIQINYNDNNFIQTYNTFLEIFKKGSTGLVIYN